jgi:acetyl-CoA carboxylase carboxyl transferase subunit beta
MAWFSRSKENILTDTKRKDIPDGMWTKCEQCGEIIHKMQLQSNAFTCPKCNYHFRITGIEYINILIDDGTFVEIDADMVSVDHLNFVDTKKYSDRVNALVKKTGLKDAIRTGYGNMNKIQVVVASMDFGFIGGSMGAVVGEKIARAIDKAIELKAPFMIVSRSGGARMMESALSLMQLAKTSSRLALLAENKIPYISILTDPTTGGATASFSMLGDINVAEPDALVGFAGPRVVKQTIGHDLPPGFQHAEFVLEHGFLDSIVHRKDMKSSLSQFLNLIWVNNKKLRS